MAKLLWLDMEMSGLDVEKERVIEVAAVYTDWDFNLLETYHSVVFQPPTLIDGMDEWNRKHHGASGLIAKIPSGKKEVEVDEELAQLTKKHFSEPAVLAGNSIGQDRLFINKYFPKFASLLHYRMVDVTSWKVVMQARFGASYKKQDKHEALADIHESIGELKYYLSFVQTK